MDEMSKLREIIRCAQAELYEATELASIVDTDNGIVDSMNSAIRYLRIAEEMETENHTDRNTFFRLVGNFWKLT